MEIDPIYMPDELPPQQEIGEPANTRSRADRTDDVPLRGCGACAVRRFGSPEDTNNRFKYLLSHGQSGLSTAFDMRR